MKKEDKEKLFALVFATTICWARQSSNGKRYKRLVYLIEKSAIDPENTGFIKKLDDRLHRLCVIDEQHRLHCEYVILIRCLEFRWDNDQSHQGSTRDDNAESHVISDIIKLKAKKSYVPQDGVPSNKLQQCTMIDSMKARYHWSAEESGSIEGWPHEKSADLEEKPSPLYFEDVVRLLQFYTKIQPSRCLTTELEGQSLFTFARLAVVAEEEVMALLHCLNPWISPMELADEGEAEDSLGSQNNEKAKKTSGLGPVPKRRAKASLMRDEDGTGKLEQPCEETYVKPKIIAFRGKGGENNGTWPPPVFSSPKMDNLSVLGICSKLRNDCIENIEQNNFFENTSL